MDSSQEHYTKLLILGLVFTLLILAGLTFYGLFESQRLVQAQAHITNERIDRGEAIYQKQCASCHGVEGNGGVGPALNNRVLLKNTFDNAFFSIIRSGVPNTQMPAWGIEFGGPLTDEDIRDLVAYIRNYEATAPEIAVTPVKPDPARGALLFVSTCAICHGENGLGGKNAPKLNDPARLQKFSDDWYRNVIRNGRPAKGMPTWGTVLSPGQVDDLVALIAAWRAGETIQAEFSFENTVDLAIFALENDDPASGALHIQHALEVANDQQRAPLLNASERLIAGDIPGALAELKSLRTVTGTDIAAGTALYSTNCAACHGAQGEGGIGLPLQSSAFVQGQSDQDLLSFIKQGRAGTAMVGFQNRLSDGEIMNIIALIRLWNP